MASSSSEHPSSSANRSSFKLIIKAANQKFEDFIIDTCELDWSIKYLKEYLSNNYPKNPNSLSIRLIYSGKLLHDHFTLKDCIRHNSEVSSHIIHLVHTSNSQKLQTDQSLDENDLDLDNELTPASSLNSDTSSTSVSTTSSSSASSINSSPNLTSSSLPNNPFSQIQTNLNNLFQQQQPRDVLSPKQQYEESLRNLTNYYQSLGVPVQTNPWYSAYIQHMALYSHMYSNYLNSISPSSGFGNQANLGQLLEQDQTARVQNVENEQPEVAQPDAPAPQPPQPVRNQLNNNNNDLNVGDREDDWLGVLHNVVSFLVLFSIVYYYSSLERFLIIFAIVAVLILYHNGWLSLQRRRVNPPVNRANNQPRQQAQNERENRNQNENNNEQNEDVNLGESSNRNDQQEPIHQQPPNLFRLMTTFVLTFFTSLIPERPRIHN